MYLCTVTGSSSAAAGCTNIATSVDEFFLRSGLTGRDQADCYGFIERLWPGIPWAQAPCQGYCSMTVFVGDDVVVQFRPEKYRLNIQIADAAREVYGSYAPDTKHIATLPKSGLLVYSMNRIAGVSFKHFRTRAHSLEHQAALCIGFAAFMSIAWHHGDRESIPLGRVGKSIIPRLQSLSNDLPARFRPAANRILRHWPLVDALPWVLTHGDIVAGNIIVEPSSGRLRGFVDWAEAERLPFGTCLYGLEEILGEITTEGFQYHAHAPNLRDIFWTELRKQIPELRKPDVSKAVELARDLGVLLWHPKTGCLLRPAGA
jgi:hypothetical protein